MAKKKKKKLKLKLFNFIIILLILFGIFGCIYNTYQKYLDKREKITEEKRIAEEQEKMLKEYNKCLVESYNEEELNGTIKNKISEIDNYIKQNYSASVFYNDVTTGFNYKYDEEAIYYGASLIKLVEAMYIFDKASNGEIDINDTIKYTSNYKSAYSDGMSKRTIDEDVSIKDLISYAIKYSDNTAHFMLSNYIGKENLKNYGKSLGAKNILTGGDSFGNQSASDTNIYLKHAYKIINSGSEYGKLLKDYMTNTYYNSLYLTQEANNNVAHKYGWYSSYYHDIGIVFEENTYYISILTNHGNGDYKTVVNNIHKKINELHHLFHEERQNNCHIKIYGE